jgi:hypothetical protein
MKLCTPKAALNLIREFCCPTYAYKLVNRYYLTSLETLSKFE